MQKKKSVSSRRPSRGSCSGSRGLYRWQHAEVRRAGLWCRIIFVCGFLISCFLLPLLAFVFPVFFLLLPNLPNFRWFSSVNRVCQSVSFVQLPEVVKYINLLLYENTWRIIAVIIALLKVKSLLGKCLQTPEWSPTVPYFWCQIWFFNKMLSSPLIHDHI